MPVEQQSKADVMTGGVFMIRQVSLLELVFILLNFTLFSQDRLYIKIFPVPQGQSRRINVAVQPVVGGPGTDSNLMRAQSISSIAIGSCYLRNRYDEPLDSYQEQDLERFT